MRNIYSLTFELASQPKIYFLRKQFHEGTFSGTFFSDSFPYVFLPRLKVAAMAANAIQ